MSTTHRMTESVAALISRAADQALEYWGLPQDQEGVILDRLARRGISIHPEQFREIVEAKIAADWARNGNDLVGYGYDGHVDHETRAFFIERQEVLAEQGAAAIAAQHESPASVPSFWHECLVGLAAMGAVAAWVMLFALMGA